MSDPFLPVPMATPVDHIPAVVPQEQLLPIIEGSGSRTYTSLPVATPLDRAKYAALMMSELPALADMVNMTVDLVHLVITTVQKTDRETGEILTLPMAILVDTEGKGCVTYGSVPCNSLRRLIQSMGRPPYHPAIPLKVERWVGDSDRQSVRLALDFARYSERLRSIEAASTAKKPAK